MHLLSDCVPSETIPGSSRAHPAILREYPRVYLLHRVRFWGVYWFSLKARNMDDAARPSPAHAHVRESYPAISAGEALQPVS
jgi:hypothetical protein